MQNQEWELEDLFEEERQEEIRRRNAHFRQQLAQLKGFHKDNIVLAIASSIACLSWLLVGMQLLKRF